MIELYIIRFWPPVAVVLTPLHSKLISSAVPAAIEPPQLFVPVTGIDEHPMANTKSAKKATRKIARRTEINKARRSRMRTSLRDLENEIATGNKAAAQAALVAAEPALMRAARAGIIHKKTASRKVSRLTRRLAKLGQ